MGTAERALEPAAPQRSALGRGIADLVDGLRRRDLWLFMGWQDIRNRYRRTILGPWWLAISTGLLVLVLGYLWSEVFAVDVARFLPYFAIGLVLWNFLSGAVNEACFTFIQFEGILKQQRLPLSALVYRIGMRHLIVFGHNVVVIALILVWFAPRWHPETVLLVIPAFALFLLGTFALLVPVAILSVRFRDLPQMIASAMQVLFFAMPILWKPDALKHLRWVVDYNPFAYLVDVVRAPLLGEAPSLVAWGWAGAFTALCLVVAAWLLGRYGRRVAYWL